MTSNLPRLWIKASPRGTRSGFTVLPDGAGGRVTVTVLPKPWSLTTGVVREYAHTPGQMTHIVLHETDLATVWSTASCIGALALSLAETAQYQSDLLTLGSPWDGPLSNPDPDGDPFESLLDLVLLAERSNIMNSPHKFEGTFSASLLRLLSHERLLKIVEALLFRARPRYAERTETLAIPRGRLNARSLLHSLATGTPRVESTYDELTTDTPLMQVIASALHVISSDRLPPQIADLRPGLHTRAVYLLRHLSSVTPLERERAIFTAERLWMGPLDQAWQPAVDAALPVLRNWAVNPEGDSESSDALLLHLPTEKFWEQCLELALESAFSRLAVSHDALAGHGVSVPAPWGAPATNDGDLLGPGTSSFPDFMLRVDQKVIVADAKYKLGTKIAPTSSDGYQLFAYSHLATLESRLSDLAALLYPTGRCSDLGQLKLERLRDHHYTLWLVHLPFPSPADLQSQQSWSIYIAELAGRLKEFSKDWVQS